MIADRKMRPQPIILEIPAHNPNSASPKAVNKAPAKEVRDADVPASPQPQQNTSHHHSHYTQHHPSSQSQQPPPPPQQQQQQQQHKASSANTKRASADRGVKDTIKTKSSTPKAVIDHVGPYLLGRTLGKGSSGCVKLARHRKTNEQVAVKIISKASLANKAAVHRGIEREIAIMKLINHPHVIRLYDVYETEKEFHRDLKPENLLLDDRMNVKIADFGMASLQKTGRLLETSCGSPHYASPEVVTGLKYDGSSSDIWSCGIILYALLTGHLPFDDENIRQLLSKVKAGKFYMPTDISTGARDLISRMLTVNPKRRITMQGVMTHPWFRMVNPDRNTLGEPAEDPESGRVLLAEELDAEIILHMRWLFAPGPSHSDPEAKEVFDEEALLREIEEKMTNNEENMEKLFYHLLCQHKTELLENYSSDDTDSSILDGPRRRADSFPNSAISARSHTPDFSRTPRSPRDSPITAPGSPLSPMIKISPVEPSPLTLNPLEAAVARAASAAKIAARTSSATTQLTSASLLTSESMRSKGKCEEAAVAAAAVAAVESRRQNNEPRQTTVRSLRKEAEPIREVVPAKIEVKAPEVTATTKNEEELSQSSQPELVHPEVTAPKAVSPIAQCSLATSADSEEASASKNSEVPKPTATSSEKTAVTAPSIESQVLSTQITEATPPSSLTTVAPIAPTVVTPVVTPVVEISDKPATTSVAPSSTPATEVVSSKPATSKKLRRPILHPLDVKASAGTTPMNVSASQHSRKSSEGSSTPTSATLISPNGPKRPWFARLFDFKPQPLTLRSNWSAAETQERLETILKNLFQSNIQVEGYKKPPYGIKCRYEGGVINNLPVKAVKFKVEISEKAGYLATSSSTMSSNSTVSNTSNQSNHMTSSPAVAAMLTTVDPNQRANTQQRRHGNHSQSHLPVGFTSGPTTPDVIASRRASDGGSILSNAAAALSTSLAAAAAKNPFHRLSSQNGSQSDRPPQLNHQPSSPIRPGGFPPLPQPSSSTLPRRAVKVTLNQQQGANSTLKLIYEQLQMVWDQQIQSFEQQQPLPSGGINASEISLIASPMPTSQKAQRGAAI
ncbi:hypothetical protein BGZ49_007661 [Haplosporangium sp. Z 27]|nr:hypothetical protein BGZ49_007661 [Haplosporangium sp. Z 27]